MPPVVIVEPGPPNPLTKPVRAFGGFIAMSLDTLVVMFRPPFAWREYLLQTWFVARVSVLPALMLTLPYSVLLVFTFNILLGEFGATDFSGTGAAIGTVNQIGPIVTVLVVSGAGATAMCADLALAPSGKNSTPFESWASIRFRHWWFHGCWPLRRSRWRSRQP